MSIQAHLTTDGEAIETSAICSRCDGDAGLRIKSWRNALEDPDYNGESRETVSGLLCYFCGRKR